MKAENDSWPEGWSGHRSRQEETWAAATPLERLRWLEEMKRFVAAAQRSREARLPGFAESPSPETPHHVREPEGGDDPSRR